MTEPSENHTIDIIVNISGLTKFGIKDDPSVSAGQLDHAAKEAHNALTKLHSMCKGNELLLEGKLVKLLSLELTGEFSVDNIGLNYSSGGKTYNQTYLKKDFYDL